MLTLVTAGASAAAAIVYLAQKVTPAATGLHFASNSIPSASASLDH